MYHCLNYLLQCDWSNHSVRACFSVMTLSPLIILLHGPFCVQSVGNCCFPVFTGSTWERRWSGWWGWNPPDATVTWCVPEACEPAGKNTLIIRVHKLLLFMVCSRGLWTCFLLQLHPQWWGKSTRLSFIKPLVQKHRYQKLYFYKYFELVDLVNICRAILVSVL